MRHVFTSCLLAVAFALTAISSIAEALSSKPNILWLVAEDINPHLGCYGDTNATTPNIDKLAARGFRYQNCWSTAPVCAPARTALITGVYPTSLGGEHMRSQVSLPSFVRFYSELLAQQGYYCVNNNKEDYNVARSGKPWAESSRNAHYKNRKPGQPFFAAFNMEITHESRIRTRPHKLLRDPAAMRIPAYQPDTPEVRHDWAQYYDNITTMDGIVGQRLKELEELGLADDTIVFFYGDNGSGMPRSKRWPYNSGLHVPLVVFVPPKFKALAPRDYAPGQSTERLVSFVDFAPSLLSLAGAQPPNWMEGRAFMGAYEAQPNKYLFGLRGRMDERNDLVRSVRNERYVYIRNYMPHLIYGQYLEYMFQTPTTRVWKKLYDEHQLDPVRSRFWETKPPEELYDLKQDGDEVVNLANSQPHESVMQELRGVLRRHLIETKDTGFLPETEWVRKSRDKSIYELAHESGQYDVTRTLDMAEKASSMKPRELAALAGALTDRDAGVRFWAVSGLLMRGKEAVAQNREPLLSRLEDDSPAVRIAAARALGGFGTDNDAQKAWQTLKQLAAPDRNGALVALDALNAICAIGDKAEGLQDFLKQLPLKDPTAHPRVNGYVQRVVTDLTSGAGK